MALAFTTITNSIAALDVLGVTIKDIDEIPEAVRGRDCPILYPEPLGFISNFVYTRDSQGGGSTALANVTYNLTYTFCYTPVGSGRGLLDVSDDIVAKVGLILDAFIIADAATGVVDLTPQDAINLGPVVDPAGYTFLGCQFVLNIMEFVN